MRSDIYQAVQPQKMARGLEFWIQEEEVLYYLSSKNKGTDQLLSYQDADLCLCFSHMQKAGFLMMQLINAEKKQLPTLLSNLACFS